MPVGTKPCPVCGSENPTGEEFCETCGAALLTSFGAISRPAISPSQPMQPLHCPRCGKQYQPGRPFCGGCGASLTGSAPVQPTQPGQLVVGMLLAGRYKITKAIAQGGMGAVFKAEDQSIHNREVVIKAMLDSSDPEQVRMSVEERRFLAEIKHPNIVQIYDFVQTPSTSYIIMEFVKGETLERILTKRKQALKPEDSLRVLLGILPAFLYLEQAKYVFNDFKPANVMEEQLRDGSVLYKLIDLGTMTKASPIRPKDLYGTPGYNAPELMKKSGPPPSANSDRYTLLRTLLQLVTNWSDDDMEQHPFTLPAQADVAVFQQHPSLYLLLEKGLRTTPDARFASTRELMEQLTGVLRQVAGENAGIAFVSRIFASEATTTIGVHGLKGEVLLSERTAARAVLQVGDAALQHGNTVAALGHYQHALTLVPTSEDARLRLAEALAETGQLDKALATAKDSVLVGWKSAWARARVAEFSGNLQEAWDHYLIVRQELPGELAPLQALARVAAFRQMYKESLDLARQIVKADPASMQGVLTLTDALWHLTSITLEDVQDAANAVYALSTHLEDARYYRAFGDLCYAAWILTDDHPLAPETVIAGLDDVSRSALAQNCRRAYQEYLKREPKATDREVIVRRRLAVQSWRWL